MILFQDLTQSYCTQTRLHLDPVNRHDTKTLSSGGGDDYDTSDYGQGNEASLRDSNTDRADQNTELEDEEVDEYLDDEEDVDDSVGDEGAMLKEAHASVQAYCRSSNSAPEVENQVGNVEVEIEDTENKASTDSVLVTSNTTKSIEEKSTENVGDAKVNVSASESGDKTQTVSKPKLSDTPEKNKDPSSYENVVVEGGCSPPSIVTVVSFFNFLFSILYIMRTQIHK